jgi:hypothetical protein
MQIEKKIGLGTRYQAFFQFSPPVQKNLYSLFHGTSIENNSEQKVYLAFNAHMQVRR